MKDKSCCSRERPVPVTDQGGLRRSDPVMPCDTRSRCLLAASAGNSLCALVAFVLLVCCPGRLWAGIEFQPVNPDELKMTSEPLAPGAPAVILYRQVDRDDSRGSHFHEDNYLRIKILTEEGRKYANIEIPFLKGADEVVHIEARTIKPDGTIVGFDGKVFEKSILKARRINYLAKTFTLPAIEPGCIIEYSYTLDLQRAYASQWILSEELFTRTARFSLKPYKSSGYMPVSLRWSWQNLPHGVEPEQGPDRIYRMEVSNVLAFQTEDFMPPANELKARVDFVYESGVSVGDPDLYWQLIGKNRNDALGKFIGKPKAIEGAVAQIVSPADAPEVKLRKIYDRVQQVRNTSFELRKTEQEIKREKEKLEENVEDVWKRGYGNQWQLNWLFLALVRAAGFEAYGCWVSSRAEYFFAKKTMQSGHLNETAVLVKLNGQDLYFNPGAEFAPFGMLDWSETGTPGLRLDNTGGSWIKTTLPKSSESTVQRTGKMRLSENGDLEGKLTVTYTGLEAMYHRTSALHGDEVARAKMLEDGVTGQIPVAAEAKLTNHPDWNNSETPLVAEFDLKIPNWSSNAGKRVVLPAGIFVAHEKHIFEHAERVHSIYFEYPYEKIDEIAIELPAGWQVSSLPPGEAKDGHVVTYSLKVENAQETLHLTRKLDINFLLLEQKYYAALRNFFQTVRTGDEEQILLQPGTASASN
jgi:hypothetical protein